MEALQERIEKATALAKKQYWAERNETIVKNAVVKGIAQYVNKAGETRKYPAFKTADNKVFAKMRGGSILKDITNIPAFKVTF